MNRLFAIAAVLVTVTVAWPSVATADQSPTDPAITSGKAAKDLSAARNKWLSSGISNYRFSIRASCFCAFIDPVTVKVRGKRKKVSNPDWFGPRSVPQLFKVVRGAIDRGAAVLTVKYDKADGHPRSIAIDYSLQIADEEIGYTVKGFEPLPVR